MTRVKFEEINLSEEILNAVKDMGFEEASPIQGEAIPLIMEGKDIIGQAQTGTGKTAAFAIPVIESLDPDNKNIQAIIMCPTRELVIQVSEEFRKLMKYKQNLFVAPVYGGQEIERQLRTLRKGVQVVIGTPGRMMDHMRRGSIKMHSVNMVVLDEADEMLDMGFREDIEFILKDTPETRQTVMFSATMADDIINLTKQYQKAPVIINVTNKKLNAPKINQVYLEVLEKNKPELLARLLDLHNIKLALVFCNTKSQVDSLVEILKTRGYFADALHGDMNQNQRDRVMNGFRNGTVEILVATDVAGRGIDVNGIEAVFNYDLPRDDEDYIHRIGRTARAGKSGTAFTFIVGKQIYNLTRIQRANGFPIVRQAVPTLDELEATRISAYSTKITEIIEAGHLSKYVNQIESVMGEEYTSLDIAAALLKIIIEKENKGFDDTINFEKPVEEYRQQNNRGKGRANNGRTFGRREFPQAPSGNRFKRRPERKFEADGQEPRPFKSSNDEGGENKSFNAERPPRKAPGSSPFRVDKPYKRKEPYIDAPTEGQEAKTFKASSDEWSNKPPKKSRAPKKANSSSSFGGEKSFKGGGYPKPSGEGKKFGDNKFRKKK